MKETIADQRTCIHTYILIQNIKMVIDNYFPLVLCVPLPPPGRGIIEPLTPVAPTPFLAAGFLTATTLPFFRGFLWHAFTPVPIKWDFQP